MKRVVLMTVLALILPAAAFGDVIFDFQNGTLSASSSGTLTGSIQISEILGLNGQNYRGLGLGTISFTTGPLMSGSLTTFAWLAPGGSFVITGSGNNGAPTGVLFSGTFKYAASWSRVGNDEYEFPAGFVSGIWSGQGPGDRVPGFFSIFNLTSTGGNVFTFDSSQDGVALITAPVANVPEPGTLGLLGAGLAAVAGAVHRKRKV